MSNRVLFQRGTRSILKVALPGYDARTAPLSKLAFDAQFGQLTVLARGIVQMPRSIGLTTSSVVYFPEWQPRPPFCLCWFAGSLIDADPSDTLSAGSPNRYFTTGHSTNSIIDNFFLSVNINTQYATFFDSQGSGRRVGYVFLRMIDPA